MKKKSILILALITLALFASSAKAPRWYRNVPDSRVKFYGTGSSELKSAEKSRKFATMRARTAVAEQVSARMQQAASDYYQENEGVANSQAIAFVEEIARQIVNVQLKYTHIEELEKGKDGVTYALVSLRSSDLRKALRETNKALKLKAKLAKQAAKQSAKNAKKAKPAIPPKVAEDASNIIQFYIDSKD